MKNSFWDIYLKFFLTGFGIFLLGIIILSLLSFGIAFSGGGNNGYLLGAIWNWCFIIPGMWVIGKAILKRSGEKKEL